MRSEPAEGNCGCSRRWGKRRQIFTWERKKSGARSSKTCADEKGTGCWARRRRWRTRWRKIGESGGGAGRGRLCHRLLGGESVGGLGSIEKLEFLRDAPGSRRSSCLSARRARNARKGS